MFEEANIALKVLLRHREEEVDPRGSFWRAFRKLIMPSLEKLRKTGLDAGRALTSTWSS